MLSSAMNLYSRDIGESVHLSETCYPTMMPDVSSCITALMKAAVTSTVDVAKG